MAKARLLAPWVNEENGERRSAMYHCVSRVVDKQFIFGDVEREEFVNMMRLYEAFCGVRVLSYCVMSNHFHILIEVPPKMEDSLSDEVLLERLGLLYKEDYVNVIANQLKKLATSDTEKGREAYQALREQFTSRMWDLGLFMKTLKQRFTTWYNKRNGRRGTLWESRYKSVLVQDGHAARVMAAYIDLNPVRAGMVSDPKDYRWSSYGASVAGGARGMLARRGLSRLMQEREASARSQESDGAFDGWNSYEIPEHYTWRAIAGRYRLILFEDGEERVSLEGRVKRKGVSKEEVEFEQERGGELQLSEILRCKTRWFMDGGVIGSKRFVREVVEGLKGSYLSEERKGSGSKVPEYRGRLWSMRQIVLLKRVDDN